MSNDILKSFCGAVRKRTKDNAAAANLARSVPSQMISILRQELDSLIRVVYLLSISDFSLRNNLMTQTLNNQSWVLKTESGKLRKITDKEMVELSSYLMGWTQSVYKFGCAFIHLSGLHGEGNPLDKLREEDKRDIFKHMRQYHGGPSSDAPSFDEFCSYLPAVLEKISGNLECYVEHLEKNETPDPFQL